LIALVPWLWPRWRRALRARDTLTAVLLAWVLIVLAFFSASSGKRGLYILPALPALVMAAAPWLPELLRARGPRRLIFTLAALLVVLFAAAAAYVAFGGEGAQYHRIAQTVADPLLPLMLLALGCGAVLAVLRLREAWLAWIGSLAWAMLVTGFVIYPRIDATRSGRAFVDALERTAPRETEIGFVDLREQFELQLERPSVHFGRPRRPDFEREAADAALWLSKDRERALVVGSRVREPCFARLHTEPLGRWHREDWFLVRGVPDPRCVQRGDVKAARRYVPPKGALNTDS
jgi:4-amino-4-deoxy-L-arabinose transferase-like glycosyltransferase